MKTKLQIAGVAIVLAALVVAFATWKMNQNQAAAEEATNAQRLGNYLEDQGLDNPGQPAEPAAVGEAAAELAGQLPRTVVSRTDAQKLGSAVTEALDAYTAGDVDQFKSMLTSRGLTPDPRWEGEDADPAFLKACQTLLGAKLYPRDAKWIVLLEDGREAADAPKPDDVAVGGVTYEGQYPVNRGPNDVRNPVAARTTQLRLIIPMEAQNVEGRPMRCRIALTFTRRPSDGEWLVTGIRVEDVPMMAVPVAGAPPFG